MPSGIEVTVDGRNQHQNKREAIKELEKRLKEHAEQERAKQKKAKREDAIRNETRVRTYDFSKGIVTDHRTGKKASLKDILQKGLLDKLR